MRVEPKMKEHVKLTSTEPIEKELNPNENPIMAEGQ